MTVKEFDGLTILISTRASTKSTGVSVVEPLS